MKEYEDISTGLRGGLRMNDRVSTTRIRCGAGCGHVREGSATGNGAADCRGDTAHPVGDGRACRRGVAASRDSGELLVRVHPETAVSHLELPDDGDHQGRYVSCRARVAATVEPHPAVPDRVVGLPIQHSKINDRTVPAVDPQSTEPTLEQCVVRTGRRGLEAAVPGGEAV